MLGSKRADGPSSRNDSCSEQTCLLPARLTWQWTLIHASTRFSFAAGFAPITIARQAWSSVISEMIRVFSGSDPGASLYTARLINDARVFAPPPSAQSFFNSRSIFPISTGTPGEVEAWAGALLGDGVEISITPSPWSEPAPGATVAREQRV